MFHQLLTPVGDALLPSFLVAAIPIAVVLALLGVFRRPAWQASLVGLIVAFIIAVTAWQVPADIAASSVANGIVFAAWNVMWIVFSALVLYNIAVKSGRFDQFRQWMLENLPNDRRLVLLVVGFSFGCLLEGVAGFGTPVAITSALLIGLGFPVLEALTFTLIFNTAPVAFGALGAPITVLGAVTHLSPLSLGMMVGRQLPFFALLLPFYVIALYGGWRSVKALWPALLVAGASFALAQFTASNYIDYQLTDVLASLFSLIVTIGFLKVWRPDADPAFAVDQSKMVSGAARTGWGGWVPWLILSVVVIAWIRLKVPAMGAINLPWPDLDKRIAITLYNDQPYGAIWSFQPLQSGTAIFLTAIITALWVRLSLADFVGALIDTWIQIRIAIATVCMIVGLAYILNYSGMSYTLGKGVSSVGGIFPILSVFLGWLAVFLSGSDTSGNALFGNLQVVAANQLGLNPTLMAAANSSGGVMGKMISPQNIATGVSVTELKGREGEVFARTFKHSIFLTFLLGVLVYLQQNYLQWMIPGS